MEYAETIDAILDVVPMKSVYESHTGITHTVDAFKAWRSIPAQVRIDVLKIIWNSTVLSGDIHVRNGGRAISCFLEYIDAATESKWPTRPVMPGDPDEHDRMANKKDLEKKLKEASIAYHDLLNQVNAL